MNVQWYLFQAWKYKSQILNLRDFDWYHESRVNKSLGKNNINHLTLWLVDILITTTPFLYINELFNEDKQ